MNRWKFFCSRSVHTKCTCIMSAVLVLILLTACGEKNTGSDNAPEGMEAPDEAAAETVSAADIEKIDAAYAGLYGYDLLATDSEKVLYHEILTALDERREGKLDPETTKEKAEQVYLLVMADHPELFYVGGYDIRLLAQPSGSASEDDSAVQSLEVFVSFKGKEDLPSEEIEEKKNQLEAQRSEVLASLPADAGEYETARQIYEYVILHTIYGGDTGAGQTADSALLEGRAVCTGYARAVQYLLQGAGIRSTLVTGRKSGRSHAWLLVKLDGEYYYMDPTEGDSLLVNMPSNYRRIFVNYTYFAMTSSDIAARYTDDGQFPLPECTAMTDSYFVREDRYISTNREAELEGILQIPAWTGESAPAYVQLRCTGECYEETRARLVIEDGPVSGNGWICSANEETGVLTFYLPVSR